MDTSHEHTSGPAGHPESHHEESDVHVRGIVGFGLGLALCIGLSAAVLYYGFGKLREGFTETPANASPLIGVHEPEEAEKVPQSFPNPRLQTNYYGDLDAMRKQWDKQLTTDGWQDKNAGIVHIKIDRAMELILQRGLPVRGNAAAQPGARTRAQSTAAVAEKPATLTASSN